MSNIKQTKDGLTEKSTGRKIESPLDVQARYDKLAESLYPLSIDRDIGSLVSDKIHRLAKMLKPKKLNQEEYELLNEISGLFHHPVLIK